MSLPDFFAFPNEGYLRHLRPTFKNDRSFERQDAWFRNGRQDCVAGANALNKKNPHAKEPAEYNIRYLTKAEKKYVSDKLLWLFDHGQLKPVPPDYGPSAK